MAVIKRAGPRPGLSVGKGKVDMTKVSYTVVKTISNALKIAGKRRQKGDVFEAIPRHVRFLLLEGVIAPTPAAAPAAATSASTSSATSSASSSTAASAASSSDLASSASSTSSASSASTTSATSTKAAKAAS
ncbi:MAG: hypothetical protein ACLPGW_19435 [Roseiarcus sp.]